MQRGETARKPVAGVSWVARTLGDIHLHPAFLFIIEYLDII